MGVRQVVERIRSATRSGGAQGSGLTALLELCFVNACADTFVAIALADTVFFAVPAGQARAKVALYLITTMAPFAMLAPVVGPLLDRFSHGRRIALAATFLARAALAWALAGHDKGLTIYPVALGVLIGSRAFSLAKSSAVPRVVPTGSTLVQSNSRLALTGVAAALTMGPLAIGLSKAFGHSAVLRVASVIFLGGVLLCTALPDHIDDVAGETKARGVALPSHKPGAPSLGGTPHALRSQAAMRALMGFLTLFLAFQLRGHGNGTAALGGLALAASAGSAAGVWLGNVMRRHRPEGLLSISLGLCVLTCVAGAIVYSIPVALIVALVVSLSANLGKISLDSVIQRDVDQSAQASAFGKSETALQLAWVIGGGIGLIPFSGTWGFGLAAVAIALAFVSRLATGGARSPR